MRFLNRRLWHGQISNEARTSDPVHFRKEKIGITILWTNKYEDIGDADMKASPMSRYGLSGLRRIGFRVIVSIRTTPEKRGELAIDDG
ncbi:MAG: hypothetical protein MSG64_14210 [Pyrinomonadaceae bacterium MAG19_C2-C3]|nr:hypothetical protein [Pyrinomonadaceae bacterium MAG19_C2-C3]